MIISVENGLRLCKEILTAGGIELLAVEAAEIYNKHWNGIPLSTKERFIIGLAYSEFYTNETTDNAYVRASIKCEAFCKQLGIKNYNFTKEVEKLL